ncbi:MAG: sulfatase-like hydrolase/transferase [Caldilineaceae bacterium]
MPTTNRPNILLITSDQQRYDTLGVSGNALIHTPNLDNLASQGINFQRAYVNNPVCIASRACIQTGRYTHQHGVEYMEDAVDETPGLPPWEMTFMERLQATGYHTAAFGKLHMLPPKGFDEMALSGGQGARWTQLFGSPLGPAPLGNAYAQWLEARRPGAFAALHEQRRTPEYKEHGTAVTSVIPFADYVDTWVAENTVDFLRRQRAAERPFFAWCGFLNPHGPLDAPEPYDRMYDPQAIPLPATYLADVTDRPAFYAERQRAFRNQPTGDKLRRMLAFYYGLCTMLDDLCGRLFTTLQETGLWDNTLIIYTSDHGDMLGDFGMTGKSNFMEPTIHVPLLLKPPHSANLESFEPGRRSSDLIELIDIAPTILDYAGVPIPDTMQGVALRPLLADSAAGKSQILCEYMSNDRSIKGKCLRTAQYKYVFWTPGREEELYDLQSDPQERHNVVGDASYREIRNEMRTRLIEQLLSSERALHAWGA